MRCEPTSYQDFAVWLHRQSIHSGVSAAHAIVTRTAYALSHSAGSTWDDTAPVEPMMMRVNVDPAQVPEPSQWAMMGMTLLGAGGFALRRWRSRKA